MTRRPLGDAMADLRQLPVIYPARSSKQNTLENMT